MKLPKSNVHTETSGNIDKSFNFGIREQDTGLILEILRKKMYKDPIRAICREISCNARDAHVEAGTPDKAISITLPNALNPQLEIRDEGPGISPKRIKDIFINFGASTKRRDNKQVGGFGLGAKSGFAYGDTFTVITIHGGKKRTYTAYVDESNKGKLDLLREEKSTQHTGTSIIVPIKKDDASAFAQSIIEATAYWHVKPKLKGGVNVPNYPKLGAPMLSDEKAGWILFATPDKHRSYNHENRAKILIDRIGYNISPRDLGVDTYSYDKKAERLINLTSLLKKDLHLEFPIGSLSLASTRDNIHFDPPTIKAILSKLELVMNALLKEAVDKLQKFDNIIDAEKFWAEFKREVPAVAAGQTPSWKKVELKGLTRYIDTHNSSAPADDGVIIEHFYWHLKNRRGDSYNQEWVVRKEVTPTLNFSKAQSVFLNDGNTKLGPRAKIVSLMAKSRTSDSSHYKAIKDEGAIDDVYVMTFNKSDTKAYWYDDLDLRHVNLKLTSSLPKADKEVKLKAKRQKRVDFSAWEFRYSYKAQRSDDNYWEPCEISKNEGKGIYVIIVNKRDEKFAKMGDIRYSAYSMKVLSDLLGEPIYGIHQRYQHFIGDEWVPLEKVAKPKILEALDGFDINEAEFHAKASKKTYKEAIQSFIQNSILTNNLAPHSYLLKYIEKSKELTKLIESSQKKIEIHRYFSDIASCKNKKNYNNITHPLDEMLSEVLKLYPLLNYLDCYNNIPSKAVMDYITLIDEKESNKKVAKVA